MKNFQVKLDYGAQKWHDALYTEVDAAASEGVGPESVLLCLKSPVESPYVCNHFVSLPAI